MDSGNPRKLNKWNVFCKQIFISLFFCGLPAPRNYFDNKPFPNYATRGLALTCIDAIHYNYSVSSWVASYYKFQFRTCGYESCGTSRLHCFGHANGHMNFMSSKAQTKAAHKQRLLDVLQCGKCERYVVLKRIMVFSVSVHSYTSVTLNFKYGSSFMCTID